MEVLYLMIPIALILLALAIATFLWAVNTDQFDDLDRESRRILFEDEELARRSQTSMTNDSHDR